MGSSGYAPKSKAPGVKPTPGAPGMGRPDLARWVRLCHPRLASPSRIWSFSEICWQRKNFDEVDKIKMETIC